MRQAFGILLLLFLSPTFAQNATRFAVALDAKTYPQANAKECLASVLKAIEAKKIDYLVAQLADPTFVDDRVKRIYAGKFEEQVQDTRARLDPASIKQLRRFLSDGKWTENKSEATVTHDDIKDRVVRLVRKDGRWYLDHNNSTEK